MNNDIMHLSWRCLDNIEEQKSCFYNSKRKISKIQSRDLAPIMSALQEKWTTEFNKEFGAKKKYFTIASGNYSYFFILPDVIRLFQEKYPHTAINMKLLEIRSLSDLKEESADVLFSGMYRNISGYAKRFAGLNKIGYTISKGFYADKAYFGASNDSVKEFGTKENTIAKHNLLFGRLYRTNETTGETMALPYSTLPKGRESSIPRVITDQHYLSYVFMKYSAGIWTLFRSMNKDMSLCRLTDDAISEIDRHFIYRGKTRDKKAVYIKNKVFSLLKHRRKT